MDAQADLHLHLLLIRRYIFSHCESFRFDVAFVFLVLILKVLIIETADDTLEFFFFIFFSEKIYLPFHVNRLPSRRFT